MSIDDEVRSPSVRAGSIILMPPGMMGQTGDRHDPLTPNSILIMNRPPQITKVALVQMRCTPDPERNVDRACELLVEASQRGAQIACLPELFRSQYFCQTEDHQFFGLAEPIPGRTSNRLAEVARATGMTILGSLFERRAAGLYHNTSVVLDKTARSLASIARCTSLMIRSTTRSFISPPATSASRRSGPTTRPSAPSSAGTNGTPRPHA